MKTRRFFALLLMLAMLAGMMPTSAHAYWEETTPEGNTDLETTVYSYTKPVGVTMQRLTGSCVAEFGEDGNLGDDLLFVIKSGDRYYAMKDVPASETAYASIPAVDVTDWVNADGSLTVPADTLGVAFWRYEVRGISEYSMYVNGREDHLSYTYSYESVDGDNDYYNDAERNYWGKFVVTTYEEGDYTNTPYYWSENEVSGTLNFGGTWSYYISSYNSIRLKYELIADLRDDGLGGKEFYFRYLGTDVEFVGDEVEGYLYYTDCRHQGIVRHAEYDAPTCMLKGCEEYWYCENCNRYYKDEAFTGLFGEEMPVIPAMGHDWDSESCKNCNRPVPVYTKVTNQAQFDALADDTMYILVAEYNGKHYAMDFSEVYSYMTDSDGDGFYDIHNVDDDSDGIPDYLEFDEGGGGEWGDEPNGVYDYLEWDMDSDGDVDDYDLHEFHLMVCDQHLTDMLYSNGSINATEITINPDGTFSHAEAAKTAEFEMVDVYLAEDYNPEWHSYWENGEMPYHTKCVKQFVIPNYFLTAPSIRPVERMYQQRIYDFGDSSHWGVLFYDSRDQYFSYVDGDMDEKVDADEDGKPDPLPFPDVSKEGSVAVFDTFDDIGWILYHEGQMAQLRLRDYDGKIGFVTGHDYELDGWEWVDDETHEDGGYYNTNDTQVCVYLYASAPYTSHTCQWSDWTPDATTDTHTRECTAEGCDKKQTDNHNWDAGTETQAPTCTEPGTTTYTCPTCRATKTSPIPALDHDWDEWTYDSVDSHIRACKRTGCTAEEFGGHEWGNWVSIDDNTHKMTCSVCSGTQSDEHGWDNGVVTKEPTEWETGIKTYTCLNCGHTKTEIVDMLDHECVWTDWAPNGEQNHKRDCMDDNCDKFETLPHSWDEGEVTKQPSCSEKGEMTYTCQTCMYTRTEDIPTLDHEFGDWTPNTDDKTHSRACACGESETEEHNFDNGEVTQAPTHEAKGEIKYTCADCGYSYLDELPKIAEHQWDEWVINKVDEANTHIRYCFCGESETAPHAFDNGTVTVNPTHTSKGEMTYTCPDCGYSYTEEIDETPEHSWTDWESNGGGTHSRYCRCGAYQTGDCVWDDGVVTTEPTHTEPGTVTFTCTLCGDTYTEEIPVTPEHQWGEWVVNKQDEANTHIRYCTCDETQTAAHNFDNGAVTTEVTHTSKGEMTYTCADCGYTYTEEIPETPEHQWTDWSDNSDGTHSRACRCNATETAACTYDDGVVTQAATHYEEGETTYKCTVCGGTMTETIAKTTEHEWSEWASMNSTTHIRECKCGESQSADHNFDNGVVTKQATHLETGVKTSTCQTCGFVREETIAKTAEHSFGSWQSEATVVGKHYRECACGQRETADCTFDDGVVTAEPTYDADGTKTYTCQTCSRIKTESIDKLVKTDELIAPDNSGIKINAPDGTSAILNQNTVIQVAPSNSAISEQVKTNVVEIVGNSSFDVLASYDISLLLDGAAVQPGGKVEVTLPAPANADEYDSLQVVYIDDMGNVTPCETRVNADGSVTFITDHFSRYAIIGVQDSSPVVWILISVISVVLIAAAVIAVLGIRKKKGIA